MEQKQESVASNNISSYLLFGLIVLLPIFFWPFAFEPVSFSKGMLFYLLVAASLVAWLFNSLKKGEIVVPKSLLLVSLLGVVVSKLASSLFSGNIPLSIIGAGYEIDTFTFFAFCSVLVFLVAMLFDSEKEILKAYFLLFLSGFLVFIFQAVLMFFRPNWSVLNNVFPTKISSIIGGWNDMAIFFGFIALVSLAMFELFNFGKVLKVIFAAILGVSFLGMLVVNFSAVWITFGFFVLIMLVYLFTNTALKKVEGVDLKKFLNLSLFVLLAIMVVLTTNGLVKDLVNYLGTSNVEVRPTLEATWGVIEEGLSQNPILGSGPNTFLYDWTKYKPLSVNLTNFWDFRFRSGFATLPSMLATSGVLGGLAILFFLGVLFYYGYKAINYNKNQLLRSLLITSFFSSVYLWIFTLIYSPGLFIVFLAFLSTGFLLALLVQAKEISVIKFSIPNNPQMGFVYVLAILILVIGCAFSLFTFGKKVLAMQFFSSGIKTYYQTGNVEKVEKKLNKSLALDPQDLYYRAISDVQINKLQNILNDKSLSVEVARNNFQKTLGDVIQNSKLAAEKNKKDILNWMQLGKIYEAVVPLGIAGADGFAVDAYNMALQYAPTNPAPLLGIARVKLAQSDSAGGKEYINKSLQMKPDYASALYLLSRIAVQEGDTKEAILRTEQAAMADPNDVGVLFQLGMFYYQDQNYAGAKPVFERAVALNPYYSNARYFLGLVYSKNGEVEKAINQFEQIAKLNPGNVEVQTILTNLKSGRAPLNTISPPNKDPEERSALPVKDKNEEDLGL